LHNQIIGEARLWSVFAEVRATGPFVRDAAKD
jgi:hypothetical protein